MLNVNKLTLASLVTGAVLLTGFTVAQAAPTATITIKNNWPDQATYSSSLSSCAATVNPNFQLVNPGQTSGPYLANWPGATSFGCRIVYSDNTAGKTCQFVVSRLITQTCNPATGVCTKTWAYPAVNTSSSTGTCNSSFTSVSDTNAVVTSTNGNFSVTLTMQ